ncbi:MAG: SsrA-binding protein SmpB [Ignavibacteria bacterium]|nr:SsrA-binding protein SmpB [Ignavibacteria bacterium]
MISEQRKIKYVLKNKKALHDYEVLQKFEAGIELKGTEVKSIRQGRCNIQDSYCTFLNPKSDELFLVNFNISPYEQASHFNHEPRRPRKLLLHKNELQRLKVALEQKGLTLVPLSVYFSGPFVKFEIALVRGKKKYDKRENLRKREVEKEISKRMKV